MKTIEELMDSMSAIVDAAEAENRSLTEEEVADYEALEADLAKARKAAEVRSRHAAYLTPVRTPAIVKAAGQIDEAQERAFAAYLRTGQRNSDLVEVRSQAAGTDSAGGYLVPAGFRTKLVERMKSFGGIATVAEVIVTESGAALSYPSVDDTANAGEIVAEGGTGAAGADITFGTITLDAYRYASLGAGNTPLRVSVELLQDSAFDVAAFVSRAIGTRIARAQAADFANGTGTGEPKGLLTKTPVATAALSYSNLLDLIHTIDPDYRIGASFVMSDASLKAVRQLLDANDRPLWLPASDGMQRLPGGELLGYPVVIDADAGDKVAFGNIERAYIIRRVRDVQLVVDPYTRAAYGEVCFTAWARADADIQDTNAFAVHDTTP